MIKPLEHFAEKEREMVSGHVFDSGWQYRSKNLKYEFATGSKMNKIVTNSSTVDMQDTETLCAPSIYIWKLSINISQLLLRQKGIDPKPINLQVYWWFEHLPLHEWLWLGL